MTAPFSAGLLARLAGLVGLAVLIQISVVSEVPIFGLNVDLSPLLVVFIGLLCGAMMGAAAGFALGLLVDLTLLQTLGVSSLIFTIIGYGAGRLREVRDPQAALTPLLVGAAGTAAAGIGYAIVAPAVWTLVRRALRGSLPDDPRRRRRRAYTTGGLSPLSRA